MKQEKDRLTGLYRKERAIELIQDYLSNTDEIGVAIVLDIDNFQKVNNVFGVEKGDAILQDTANILREFFQEDDIISRTNGDQFVVFAKGCENDGNLNIRLHELCTTLEREVTDGTQTCRVSASIGVAVTGTLGRRFDSLYQGASMAMDEVKRNGKGSVEFYQNRKNL